MVYIAYGFENGSFYNNASLHRYYKTITLTHYIVNYLQREITNRQHKIKRR